jgi:hypothetical protein
MEGHPLTGAYDELMGFVTGFDKGLGDVVSSLSSPANLGLALSTEGGSLVEEGGAATIGRTWLARALKAPGRAAGVYFGAQGLKTASTPQQAGESKYDAFWRQSLGLSAFFGTVHSEWNTAGDLATKFIQSHFKLSDDLAAKVADHVNKIAAVRKQTAANVSKIDEDTQVKITALQDNLRQETRDIWKNNFSAVEAIRQHAEKVIAENQGKLSEVQKQTLRQGANTVADSMQALHQEKIRAGKPFDDIAAKINGSVAQTDEVRGLVEKAFKDEQVDVAKIPPRAVTLLQAGKEGGSGVGNVMLRTPDGGYLEVAPQYVQGFIEKGYESAGEVLAGAGLPFDRLTRIREDIGQAAESAKDTSEKRALFRARDAVTDFQEKVAEQRGQGEAYRKAKQGYMKFIRGIGSPMVHDFLNAADAERQTMAPKIADLLKDKEIGDGLRGTLKAAGVDVKPLDQLLDQQETIEQQIAETQRLAATMTAAEEKTSKAKISGRKAEVGQDIKELQRVAKEGTAEEKRVAREQIAKVKATRVRGKRTMKDLVGKDVEDLAGKANPELRAMLIRNQMDNMSASGFGSWNYLLMMYGLGRMATGSVMGAAQFGLGAGRTALPKLMENKGFQDWVVRQSGIEPGSPQAARARRGITALVKMLRSGVPQAAAANAAKNSLGDIPTR